VKVCASCGAQFPTRARVDGIRRSFSHRRFCLECSPFDQHNTSRAPISTTDPARAAALRRGRRLASWTRYGRDRRRRFKARLLAIFGARCTDCGYERCTAALEFHHRQAGTKEFGIGAFTGSWSRALDEAAKCDLLCANCHRRRHVTSGPSDGAELNRRRALKVRVVLHFGGRCVRCGFAAHVSALEFHHRDPDSKEFGIAQGGILRSWAAILAEAAKCDLVCANCHREAHATGRK